MISPNELEPVREKLERVRIIISTIPTGGMRREVAVDELESAIARLNQLIARPTVARLYAATKGRVR